MILVTAGVAAVFSAVGFCLVTFIKATQKNTLAIVELTLQMKFLTEKLAPLPKLERDVNAMYEWKRTLLKGTKE